MRKISWNKTARTVWIGILAAGSLRASEVNLLLRMSSNAVESLAPVQTPLVGAWCPACKKPVKWQWTLSDPDHLVCPDCKQRFPNKDFPLSHRADYLNNLGERVSIPYFQDSSGKKYFLAGQVDKEKRAFLLRTAEQLAYRYRVSGEERWVRPLVHLLTGLAKNFPGYLVVDGDYLARNGIGEYTSTGGPWMRDGKPVDRSRYVHPYSWTGSIWGRRWVGAIPHELIAPYSEIYNSETLNIPVGQDGITARQFIDDHLFGKAVDYLMTFDMHWHLHNNLPYQMTPLVQLATLLSRPQYAHFVWDWSRQAVRTMCSFDCIDLEGPGYHQTWIASLPPAFKALEGYADPSGYISPAGLRLDHPRREDNPEYVKAVTGLEQFVTPANGRLANIHDTTSTTPDRVGGTQLWAPPPVMSRSFLISGFKHAVLGAGSGDRQIQTRLEFSDFGNHAHQDSLSITLYAHGKELFSDIGYQRNRLRTWAEQSVSHNLVVIDQKYQGGNLKTLEMTADERRQYAASIGGDLEVFVPELPGISMIRVDGKKAYRNLAETYRRTLFQNSIDLNHPYIVDIFEVSGGRIHDYLLHGCADEDQAGSCNVPLVKMPGEHPLLQRGEVWEEPKKMRDPINCYGLFRNVQYGKVLENTTVDFRYKSSPTIGTRTHIPKSPDMELYLAESPSLRKVGHHNEDRVYDFWRPSLILRTKKGSTVFAVVHEPFSGAPSISNVEVIPSSGDSIALRVTTGGRTDEYILALSDGVEKMSAGRLQVTGMAGVASFTDDKTDLWLIGDGEMSANSVALETRGLTRKGLILGAMRKASGDAVDAFRVDLNHIPEFPVRGEYLIVTWKNDSELFVFGYELDRFEMIGGECWAVLKEDHGMKFEGQAAAELFNPNRKGCLGSFTLIPNRTSVARTPVITPALPPYSNLRVNDFIPFVDHLTVQLSLPDGDHAIHYTVDGSNPEPDSPVYTDPLILSASCTVKAATFNKGVMQSPVADQRFLATLPADDLRDAVQGMTYKLYSGRREEFLAQQDLNLLTPAGSGSVQGLKLVGTRTPYATQYDGYIQVPETGIYTFFSTAHHGAVLYIDDIKLIDAFGRGDALIWAAEIALEKGFHKIRVDFAVWRFDGVLDIEIEGPGVPRQSIPEEMLFRSPTL